MSSRKGRKRPRLKAESKAILNQRLGFGVFFSVVLAFSVWLIVSGTGKALGNLDLCDDPMDDALGQSIIIVDASDSWSPFRQQVVRNELLTSVGIHRDVSVYAVQSGVTEETTVNPIITVCNPGNWDLYLQNYKEPLGARPDQLDDRYQTFSDSIFNAIDAIAAQPSFDNSPIMETLRWAAENAAENASNYPDNLEIFLLSDLLQNSSEYSIYGGSPDLSVRKAEELAGEGVLGASGLQDAEVTLYMLLNDYPPGVSRRSLADFWEAYLRKQGASVPLVDVVS